MRNGRPENADHCVCKTYWPRHDNAFGKRHVAKLLDKIVFGSYNKRIKNPATKSDWISRDAKTVAQYRADPFCTFIPTTGFFRDLFEGLSLIHKKSNLKKIPQSLSVLFVEGTADPVGNYAKTVEKLFDIYTRKLKLTDATAIYYGEARHELLNEINGANIVKMFFCGLNQEFSKAYIFS